MLYYQLQKKGLSCVSVILFMLAVAFIEGLICARHCAKTLYKNFEVLAIIDFSMILQPKPFLLGCPAPNFLDHLFLD